MQTVERKLNRYEAKELLKRWGGTGETLQYLELREALRHAAGEDAAGIAAQIREVTAFEARMDEWMDAHLTIAQAQILHLRYIRGEKWSEIAQETGLSESRVRHIHGEIMDRLVETWEEE